MPGLGVDGCKGGWLFVRLDRAAPSYGVVATLAEVVERSRQGDAVLADVPMGLLGAGPEERECDVEARRLLAARSSSVFPVPCRAALDAGTYEEASRVNEDRTGRRLSRQTWGIVPRIREADRLRARSPEARDRLRECHPEVVFWALAGGRPMPHPKKTREGFLDRVALLEAAWPGAEALAAQVFVEHGGFRVSRDDVVDAMACAVAALASDDLASVPEPPQLDENGLRIEIVHPRTASWTGPLPSEC